MSDKRTYADRREYLQKFQREWMRARRKSYLLGKSCVDCGCTQVDKLELDHRDKSTKTSHRIFSWKKERILNEMAKCDIRCRRCHQKRHAKEMIRHGTRSRYSAGCRCNECRQALAIASARWRQNAKLRRKVI